MKSILLLMYMLPTMLLTGGLSGLLGTAEPVPDPMEIIGQPPIIYEEDVQMEDTLYTSFAYPMPEDMDEFMEAYIPLAEEAGYKVSETTLPGTGSKKGPFAFCISAGARKAYLVPNYKGCLLLMVDNDLDFVHIPAPPATEPLPPPEEDSDEPAYIPNTPGRHVEYKTAEVDCPSCIGGTCSVCKGTGSVRMYGVAVSCDRDCSSCDGAGYIIQRQPVWVYD